MQPIIEANGLKKVYKDFTLGPLHLSIPAGCITGFIGENGAGKSTTIKLLLGLVHRDAGTCALLGEDSEQIRPSTFEEIGVVMSESGFSPLLTAKQIGGIMRGIYKHWDAHQYEALCKRFQLPEKKKLDDYSHGMRRKLDIAVALSHGARLLILDEATSGLDPIVRDEILDVLLDFIQQEDHAVLLSSHILSDLEKICDYIAFIHKGQLLFFEQKDTLLERFCVAKGSEEAFAAIDPRFVHGMRRNRFGVEALCEREGVKHSALVCDPANIEDIMIFHIKEEQV
ncbi:ABC transporter ATP-binding protein [Christensenellaceae bacterium OttesenSCG-928-L17]|nr:ABC transporter ATP-binding protein [Christensenellaceae bacterium OttesenSCG-928-L17]